MKTMRADIAILITQNWGIVSDPISIDTTPLGGAHGAGTWHERDRSTLPHPAIQAHLEAKID